MRAVIQRVTHASVTIDGNVKSKIGNGFLILLGVEASDSSEDVDWLVRKVAALRVFDDENGVMNRSLIDVDGEALVVSQFTLFASYKKGNRPSWLRAATHDISVPLYEEFCTKLLEQKHVAIIPGDAFGASGEGYCRVSYAYSVEHLTEALKRIREFLVENNIYHGN